MAVTNRTTSSTSTASDDEDARQHVVTSEESSVSNSNHDGSKIKDTPKDQSSKKKMTYKEFVDSFSLWTLLDPSQPWVLVDEGSFLGYFDMVPRNLRVGPWSIAAICYIAVIWYGTAAVGVHFYNSNSNGHPLNSTSTYAAADAWSDDSSASSLEYPAVGTLKWYYHACVFAWMAFVNYLIVSGPLTVKAWGTYTVQSWTLLWIRHLLCACAPFSQLALQWAEYIRFPVACSTTITFVIWNVALMPFIWYIQKTPERRRGFLKFSFSFRLVQIHGFNILYGILNLAWASPKRRLEYIDLYFAICSVVGYMAWYLFFCDRMGVHLYPLFSPRAPGWLVLVTWTSLFLVYFTTFWTWQRVMWPEDESMAVIGNDEL